jgi:hypothetical protein
LGSIVDAERLAARGRGLPRRDVVRCHHCAQDVAAAPARQLRVQERVVLRRRLRQPGDQGDVGEAELPHRLVEEQLGGGADADRRLPADRSVGDVGQVVVEDPGLAVLVLELLGELGLDDLVLQVVVSGDLRRHVLVVDELHRQRRRTLQRVSAAEQVLNPGAQDPLVIERAVLVEAPVLDRDRGPAERGRDPRDRNLVVDSV